MTQLEEMYTTFRNGDPVITVTQSLNMLKGNVRRKRPAFEEWQKRLNAGDRLPRGRYFTGKKPGLVMRFIDEFHLANSSS
ncbi:MAG: hypothetical protein E6663_05705 [Staphylococcus lugdunensis]|nr:hypothetical protein [Staphylococcus lugdunensis]